MLTLIGTLLGLLGSLAPEIVKFWNNKEDHKHEIEMGKLQMEAQTLLHEQKIEEINVQADVASEVAVYAAAKIDTTGWKFIDGIVSLYNHSVRPTLTYGFFFLYGAVKYAIYTSYTQAGYSWQQAMQGIWNSEDFAVFSTVVAFWFGSRMMKWSLERIKK